MEEKLLEKNNVEKRRFISSHTIRYALSIVVALLIGYTVGVNKISYEWSHFQPHVEVSSKEPPPSISNIDFSPMWVVLQKIESTYYDKKAIDPQKILNGAITGMVGSLDDPYTVYLPPKQNTDFKDVMAGKFEGIGAELGMKDKQIIVVAPLDGSPAKKAGIRDGDAILKVDDKSTNGWTLAQAVDKIRGPKGSTVNLEIYHKNAKESQVVAITRDTITVKSITTWVKPVNEVEAIKVTDALKPNANKKIAYIRLSQFGDTANQEWENAVTQINLARRQDPSIAGLVFDLRNNPGGYLADAVFIASEFIDSGTIVMQEDREGNVKKENVSRPGVLTDIPLVVLLNKGSASASEIVSGALSDHKRATLVGDTSFGKGTVQQAEDLGGGAGLHVTVAKWLTPNGTWVHQKGLKPDVQVGIDEKDPSHDSQLEKAIETLLK